MRTYTHSDKIGWLTKMCDDVQPRKHVDRNRKGFVVLNTLQACRPSDLPCRLCSTSLAQEELQEEVHSLTAAAGV